MHHFNGVDSEYKQPVRRPVRSKPIVINLSEFRDTFHLVERCFVQSDAATEIKKILNSIQGIKIQEELQSLRKPLMEVACFQQNLTRQLSSAIILK